MEYPRKDPCSQKPKCVYHLTQHMVSQLRRTHN
jgi:hypothetical protein